MLDKNSKFTKPSLWSRFLFLFSGFLRCRIINGNHGEPYLERYHLFRLPGGASVYLHRFLASDPDRGLHDHPWQKATGFILSGSYQELRLIEKDQQASVAKRQFTPGKINHIRGDDFHRIVLNRQKQVWTLFSHGKKCKDWGFLTIDDAGKSAYRAHDNVTNEQSHEQWWSQAPRGRNLQRMVPTS